MRMADLLSQLGRGPELPGGGPPPNGGGPKPRNGGRSSKPGGGGPLEQHTCTLCVNTSGINTHVSTHQGVTYTCVNTLGINIYTCQHIHPYKYNTNSGQPALEHSPIHHYIPYIIYNVMIHCGYCCNQPQLQPP